MSVVVFLSASNGVGDARFSPRKTRDHSVRNFYGLPGDALHSTRLLWHLGL